MIDVPFSEFGRCIEDYDVFELTGNAGLGTVFRARCKKTGKEVGIKKIDKEILEDIERVRQEAKIQSTLNYESILTLYTFFEDEDFVYLVRELCPDGNLDQKLKQMGRPFTEEEAAECLGQLFDDFIYLHSRGIILRNLHPRNLLLSNKGKIKIADFGLAAKIKTPEEKHMTFCYTPNYISSEMSSCQSNGLKAGVRHIGCLLHIMLIGDLPGRDVKYMFSDRLSPNAKDLICQCLEKNGNKRIKFAHILRHGFFSSYVDPNSRRSDIGNTHNPNTASTQIQRQLLSAVCEEWKKFTLRIVPEIIKFVALSIPLN